uniref:wings apart-like protein homolog isoform X1 n=1 Tax=Agelaius phoeniceus TaxID=39638 RepID=UPI0023ED3470|nr:wings apart-like protein homolog isoform X1 [Agelaius phoeniceus]XP_054493741.1 wings apart-like protein homolog isoform X1 [Agelaius phoeniceus]XP_054493742.1 wings apart-like protein homolog isoform X1 [Agelaius phoeniceus]
MTSRFGKTYSRKGGNGSSKFDEVFSNKRTTLSTKWGETTFMAKLGQKRPSVKPDISEVPKKPKVEDEVTEDPFGFDSDEESLPVSSKNVSQAKSSSQLESGEAAQSEDFTPLLEANSRINQPDSGENVASSKCIPFDNTVPLLKEKSTSKSVEDGECKSSSAKLVTADKIQNLKEDNGNSHFIYDNAGDSTKTSAETTDTSGCNTEAKDLPDSWDSHVGKPANSASETSQTKGPLRTHLYEWEDETEDTRTGEYILAFDNEHLSEVKSKDEECDKEDSENPKEAISEELVQTIPRPSNCRTYCRSNKAKLQGATNFDKLMDGTSQSLSKANNESNNDGLNAGKKVSLSSGTSFRGTVGRTRDYTVLHPSCLSVCNVTIQDTMERMDEFTSAAPTDLGEAGRLRKKADMATTKTTTRFRPSNTKSKKDVKLEFFGFDDQDEGGGDEGASRSSGSSNYKIKYFGFDDLSESEDEDEEWQVAERKANKKRSRTVPSASLQSTSDGNENCSQDSQLSTNADLEFSEDASGVHEGNKKSTNKQGDKSKENTRKIFSGPKRSSFRNNFCDQQSTEICARFPSVVFGQSPTKAVYNARHWNQPESEALPAPPALKTPSVPVRLSSKEAIHKDDGVFKAPAPPPKVIKTVTIPTQPYQEIVTALKCRKEDKELYTVVQHVKHFNDVVEFGENQEFTDDIEYLLSGLKSNQPLNTRCLSVISLATKCAMPSFRMHLRAHGMVAMVFKTLDDSQHHQNLSLCTAALMYILSRDRLNMDLDRASLDLMIRLLELEQDASSAKLLNEKDMNKIKEKIRRLCETVHNKHLDLENITTGHLAMETLLSLTSKRAGDWFKEELRLLGGLDHIVDKVKECVDHLSSDENEEKLVASLWGAERCLRVLESVTVHNPENQSYLIAYKDSQLIVSSAKALQHCEELIQRYNRAEDSICLPDNKSVPHQNVTNHVGKAVEDCMRAIIGVLLNLTNDNEWGSTKTGEQDGLIGTAMNCVLQVPKFLPQEQRFDIRVLGLGLLINLVEYSARNRHCLVNMETSCSFDSLCTGEGDESLKITGQIDAVQALVQLFLECERAAQLAESQTDELIKEAPTAQHDKSGEWQETSGEIQWVSTEKSDGTEEKDKKEEDDEELDLNKALQHAGKHMEDCIVASYTALLLGCLCQESPINVTTVREYLPEGDFSIMTEMLKKFLSFMNLTCAVGTTGQKSISRVIEYLEHC